MGPTSKGMGGKGKGGQKREPPTTLSGYRDGRGEGGRELGRELGAAASSL